jgi:hypothetical protein
MLRAGLGHLTYEDLGDDGDEVGGVGEIAVVEDHLGRVVGIGVQVVQSSG